MITFSQFRAEHLSAVVPQKLLAYEAKVAVEHAQTLASGVAFSGWVDGKCVGAAGFYIIWGGRATCWAVLSSKVGPHLGDISRFVRRVLAHYEDAGVVNRFEATVNSDFEDGLRWARVLGFSCETPGGMRKYGPGGESFHMFARVRH